MSAVTKNQQMRLVIVESPYAGDIETNTAYARAAVADCLQRGEAPLASHLLYTQPGVLRDDVPGERTLGIEAGLAWGHAADLTAVYADRGITPGMEQGITRAIAEGCPVEYRYLTGCPCGRQVCGENDHLFWPIDQRPMHDGAA